MIHIALARIPKLCYRTAKKYLITYRISTTDKNTSGLELLIYNLIFNMLHESPVVG